MKELKRLRKERGLSHKRLQDLSGVHKVTIIQIEQGRQSPKLDTLERLAKALNVEIGDLFPKVQGALFPPESGTFQWMPGTDPELRRLQAERWLKETTDSAWLLSRSAEELEALVLEGDDRILELKAEYVAIVESNLDDAAKAEVAHKYVRALLAYIGAKNATGERLPEEVLSVV